MPDYPQGLDPLTKGIADMIGALFDEDKIPMNADFNGTDIQALMKLKLIDTYFVKYYMDKEEYNSLLVDKNVSKIDQLIRDYGAFKIGKSRKGRKELIEALKAMFSSKKSLGDKLKNDSGG